MEDTVFSGSRLYYECPGVPLGWETLGGIYDKIVWNKEGDLVPTSIDLTLEQQGASAHFLDMEKVQDGCGTTHLKMYDKRDSMTTVALFRKFPHIETKLSARCKYSVLHSQLSLQIRFSLH